MTNCQGRILACGSGTDPERYCVVAFAKTCKATSIEERPVQPQRNFADTRLYFYGNQAGDIAKAVKPRAWASWKSPPST